jgi:hypothetical protein
MSIENLPNKESTDEMELFRKKVSDLIQDERQEERDDRKTAHFEEITDIKKFADSLTEEDLSWFNFVEKARSADPVLLKEDDIVTYEKKLKEFKNIQKSVPAPRGLLYEFFANKLTAFSFKLQTVKMRRGDTTHTL